MIACPACLKRVFRVVQPIRQHVEETRRVALHAPLVIGIFLAQRTLRLDVLLVLRPVLLAQLTLLLPRTLVPDELQVVLELLAQPHVRAAGTVHAVGVVHVLVSDGIEAEFLDEVFDFV